MKRLAFLLFTVTSINTSSKIFKLETIDFDYSLGKDNSYFHKYYEQYMAHMHTEGSLWSILFDKNRSIAPLVKLCKTLYEKNKSANVHLKPRIPLKIHQIWLGSPLPERYKQWQKTWQSLPNFTYKLWTDKDVETLDFKGKDIYYKAKNYGQRADILRMVILEKEGGIYADIDFECLNPQFFELLNHTYDFYAGLHPLDAEVFALENALIASIAHHPITKTYLELLPTSWNSDVSNDYEEVVLKTGPGLFTQAFYKVAGKKYKDIALPPTFFYPLGLAQWDFMKRFEYESIKAQILKPESCAIHWWHGTWKASEAYIRGKDHTKKRRYK